MHETRMCSFVAWQLEAIAQRSYVFGAGVVRFDGLKMFEDLSLVFGLRIIAYEDFHSNELMLADYVSHEMPGNKERLTPGPYTARP
jgi:hypothetical protein